MEPPRDSPESSPTEPGESNDNRRELRQSHKDFANEVVDFFLQHFEMAQDERRNFVYMDKAVGDSILSISYLFRKETRKMCQDMHDYILQIDHFVNYCRAIRVCEDERFFYNYLRRVSIILDLASYCHMKGHDFFDTARKCIGMVDSNDLFVFRNKGGWSKLRDVAFFIGKCGDRLQMLINREQPAKRLENFIAAIEALKSRYLRRRSVFVDGFRYLVEIQRKLIAPDGNVSSDGDPHDSSSPSDGEDENPPSTSEATPAEASASANVSSSAPVVEEPRPSTSREEPRPSTSREEPRPSTSREEPRPSTSREAASSSREAEDPRVQISGEEERAILRYLLRCCPVREESDSSSDEETSDSKGSSYSSRTTESEAEKIGEFSLEGNSSDSDEERRKTSVLEIYLMRRLRRKRPANVSAIARIRDQEAMHSASTDSDEPQCTRRKLARLSNEPGPFMISDDTSTSIDDSMANSEETSEQLAAGREESEERPVEEPNLPMESKDESSNESDKHDQ